MKLSPIPKKTSKVNSELSIGLEPHTKRFTDDDADPISFMCKMHPNNELSPEYVVKIQVFDDQGGPEDFIDTLKKMQIVQEGQNIQTNADRVKLIRQIFSGSTMDAFENELPDTGAISNDVYDKALQAMTRVVFQIKAARNQKRAMKLLKKPIEWSFSNYANRMKKMNDYIRYFPKLANGETPTPMPTDEFHKVLHNNLSAHYQKFMRQAEYDPTVDTFHHYVEYISRCCEPDDLVRNAVISNKQPQDVDKAWKSSTPKKNKRKQGNNNYHHDKDGGGKPYGNNKRQKRKFCIHHKWCDHTTNECKVVQSQMKNVPPPKKFEKRSNDFHSMEKVLESDDFHTMVKEGVTKTCNSLFKAFKQEIAEDLLLIEQAPAKRKAAPLADNECDENSAYKALLSLNQAPLDDTDMPSDEEAKATDNSDGY